MMSNPATHDFAVLASGQAVASGQTVYAQWYRDTIVGDIYLTSNGTELTGLWFSDHQKYWEPKPEDILTQPGNGCSSTDDSGNRVLGAGNHGADNQGKEGFGASDLPIFEQTRTWLDAYFAGTDPGPIPPVNPYRVTPFRRMVCEEMCKIPYGETTTYGAIAQALAKRLGKQKMSARAVGGGVGHNPIGIIIPCHRVVGANKSLTGDGGGMSRKIALLELEGFDMTQFTVPTKGTAL